MSNEIPIGVEVDRKFKALDSNDKQNEIKLTDMYEGEKKTERRDFNFMGKGVRESVNQNLNKISTTDRISLIQTNRPLNE